MLRFYKPRDESDTLWCTRVKYKSKLEEEKKRREEETSSKKKVYFVNPNPNSMCIQCTIKQVTNKCRKRTN